MAQDYGKAMDSALRSQEQAYELDRPGDTAGTARRGVQRAGAGRRPHARDRVRGLHGHRDGLRHLERRGRPRESRRRQEPGLATRQTGGGAGGGGGGGGGGCGPAGSGDQRGTLQG